MDVLQYEQFITKKISTVDFLINGWDVLLHPLKWVLTIEKTNPKNSIFN
jgi:hypothetical protein